MEIRAATVDDLNVLAPLFDAYRQFYQQAPDLDRAREFLAERFERGESWIFLATIDNRPAGFVQLYPSFSSVQTRRILVLNDLFVAEGARGKGVGDALMAAAEQFASEWGAAQLTLETGCDNHPAQELYEKRGWKKVQDCFFYNLALKTLLIGALLLGAASASAGVQSWFGLGAGGGGLQEARDGRIIAADLGLRWNENSIRGVAQFSLGNSIGDDPIAESALLYGRTLHRSHVRIEFLGGPSWVEVPSGSGQDETGIMLGAQVSWAFVPWMELSVRPFFHQNSLENYRSIVVQLNFGKLR